MDVSERFRGITTGLLMYVAMYALAAAVGILSQGFEGTGPRVFGMFAVVTFALTALLVAALVLREGALIVGNLASPGAGLWLLRILVLAVLACMILWGCIWL